MARQRFRLAGVREHSEEYGVELVRDDEIYGTHGRLCIRAQNEGGNNETLVDLWDVIEWLRFGPVSGRTEAGFHVPIDGRHGIVEG